MNDEGAVNFVDRMITEGLLIESLALPSVLIPDPSSVQWAHTQDDLPDDPPTAVLVTQAENLAKRQSVPVAATTEIPAVPKMSSIQGNRSLAATKMYVIDMLKLMFNPTSAAYISAIQASANGIEMMQHVLSAMQYVQGCATPSYAVKVMRHLQEVIPFEYLEQVDLMIFDALLLEEKQVTY